MRQVQEQLKEYKIAIAEDAFVRRVLKPGTGRFRQVTARRLVQDQIVPDELAQSKVTFLESFTNES